MSWRRLRVLVLLAETLVLLALATTLRSLHHDQAAGLGPDGIENLFQLPLALPWSLVVPPSGSRAGDAWVDAGLGALNVGVLGTVVVLDARSRCHPALPGPPGGAVSGRRGGSSPARRGRRRAGTR